MNPHPAGAEPKEFPDEFICPLTYELFREPFLLPTGQSIEKKSIEILLGAGKPNPFSSATLTRAQVVPNTALKKIIYSVIRNSTVTFQDQCQQDLLQSIQFLKESIKQRCSLSANELALSALRIPSWPFPTLCQWSLQELKNPVTTLEGITYERKVIEAWLEKNERDPLTGNPLLKTQLIPNLILRDSIASLSIKQQLNCRVDANLKEGLENYKQFLKIAYEMNRQVTNRNQPVIHLERAAPNHDRINRIISRVAASFGFIAFLLLSIMQVDKIRKKKEKTFLTEELVFFQNHPSLEDEEKIQRFEKMLALFMDPEKQKLISENYPHKLSSCLYAVAEDCIKKNNLLHLQKIVAIKNTNQQSVVLEPFGEILINVAVVKKFEPIIEFLLDNHHKNNRFSYFSHFIYENSIRLINAYLRNGAEVSSGMFSIFFDG